MEDKTTENEGGESLEELMAQFFEAFKNLSNEEKETLAKVVESEDGQEQIQNMLNDEDN